MKKVLLGMAAMAFCLNGYGQTMDPAVYEPVEGYALVNLWNRSAKTMDLPEQLTSAWGTSRGMAYLNGKIYLCNRSATAGANHELLVFNAHNGEFMKKTTLSGEVGTASLGANDIVIDDAGHMLICPIAVNTEGFNLKVWRVNPETGEQIAKVLDFTDATGVMTPKWRIDCIDVYGDITKDGIIMAAVAEKNFVVKWNFVNGVAQAPVIIEIQKYPIINKTPVENNGTAPRVTIIDDNLFYLDGFTGYATVYDADGVLIEELDQETSHLVAPGNNGVDEFELNGKRFVVYAMSNTDKSPAMGWNIAELGEGGSFNGMKFYFQFPEQGLGSNSNPGRTAVPRIEVKNNVAHIYIYGPANGLAAYKFGTIEAGIDAAMADKYSVTVQDGLITATGASALEVYSIDGKLITSADADNVAAPESKGLYIVKVKMTDGMKAQKIVIE
ncbi:MAG: T9SS type A sorting domain-containing protein [Bacteroidales bacterium]